MTALAPLANLKGYLDITHSEADAELQRMIEAASEQVEQYCERSFSSGSRTELRNGNGRDLFLMKDYPITTVASVIVDGVSIPAIVGTAPGYGFTDNKIYLIGYEFSRGRYNCSITYTAGYTTIPHDIQHSVIETAAQAFREKEWIGFQSKTLAGETVSFLRNGVPDSAKTALGPYRRTYGCD